MILPDEKGSLERKNILPYRFIELEEQFVNECVECGLCIDKCPCIPMGRLGDIDSKDMLEEIKSFLRGGNFSELVVEKAFTCSRCGICLDICPKKIDGYGLQQALRCHAVHEDKRELSLHGLEINNRVWDDFDFDNMLASIQVKPHERRWIDGIPKTKQQKDTVVYLGCSTIRYVSKINVMLDILDMLGIDYVAIAGICCGTRAQIVGKLQEADSQGLKLISVLKDYFEPKEVIVYCPTCLYTIGKELRKITGLPFSVKSVLNTIAENVDKLSFRQPIEKKVAFHDPCKLGRMYGEYEAPRTILRAIPGVTLLEMLHHKKESNCCGGTAWRYNPEYANQLRNVVYAEATEAGIDILATACLICYNRFVVGAKGYSFQIMDLLELLGKSLGIQYEDNFEKYMNYHDPECVIKETEENIAASPYSVYEMRQVLQHLLK